jgi:hypothetical protein
VELFQSPSRPSASIANSRASEPRGPAGQSGLPGIDPPPRLPETERPTRRAWGDRIRVALVQRSPRALQLAEDALLDWPTDAEILPLATLTALAANQPDRTMRRLKRYGNHYEPGKSMTLLVGITLAQKGQFAEAWATLAAVDLTTDRAAHTWFIGHTSPASGTAQLNACRKSRVSRRPSPDASPRLTTAPADRGSSLARPGRTRPDVDNRSPT